jgi:aldehyde dehydrogenase (NAD+)
MYNHALAKVVAEGGKIVVRWSPSGEGYESGCYVKPAIAEADNSFEIVQHETLLQFHLLKYSGTVEDALAFKTELHKVYHRRL